MFFHSIVLSLLSSLLSKPQPAYWNNEIENLLQLISGWLPVSPQIHLAFWLPFCLLSRTNLFQAADTGSYKLFNVWRRPGPKVMVHTHSMRVCSTPRFEVPFNWGLQLIRPRVQGNRQPPVVARGFEIHVTQIYLLSMMQWAFPNERLTPRSLKWELEGIALVKVGQSS